MFTGYISHADQGSTRDGDMHSTVRYLHPSGQVQLPLLCHGIKPGIEKQSRWVMHFHRRLAASLQRRGGIDRPSLRGTLIMCSTRLTVLGASCTLVHGKTMIISLVQKIEAESSNERRGENTSGKSPLPTVLQFSIGPSTYVCILRQLISCDRERTFARVIHGQRGVTRFTRTRTRFLGKRCQ